MSQQMTHKEFCCWLEGFFMRGGETPTAEQWQMIGVRLQKVLNPAQVVTSQDVSDAFRDKFFGQRKESQNIPVQRTKLGEMQNNTRTVKFQSPEFYRALDEVINSAKPGLDECSQGEQKKNDEPVKTIGDLARESLNKSVGKDITPQMIMADLDKQVRNMTGIPFHTPQAPFNGEGY